MKPQIRFTLFLFFVLSFQVVFAQINQKDLIGKADSLINTYGQVNAPGMAFAVIKDGKVIYKKTVGLANLESRTPITDSTAFNIASVSKQFTAFLTLLAEKEGRLSLDDDIRTYLPELKGLSSRISIRQLANHTNGFPNISEIKKLQGYGDEFKLTNEEAVKTLLQIKNLNFTPGSQYQYNNTGFTLLAEILHRVYKKDFGVLLNEYITGPLQMQNTMAVSNPDNIIPNKAESYQQRGKTYFKLPIGQMVSGSSNIYTTLNDLCRWAVNFHDPKLGSRAIYNTMQKSTVLTSGKIIEYGLGLQTERYKGLGIIFHGGGTVGYRTYILHVPAQRFSIVMLGNKHGFEGLSIVYQLVDLFLENQQIAVAKPRKIAYTPSELKDFEGVYKVNPGNYLEIAAKGKELYVGTYSRKGKEQLQNVGDNKFNITSIPTAGFTFMGRTAILRIADFSYTVEKIKDLPEENKMALKKLTGFYRNEEFNTIYELLISNNKLIARHPLNGDIELFPLKRMSFYSTTEYFGQIDFKYYKNNEVTEFMLSGANILNIKFKKIK